MVPKRIILTLHTCCGSVAKSCLTLCDPHGLQHTRLPCPSLSPGVCSNSCPLSQWCHPTISSSATFFSSCPQSFPAGSFPMSQGLFRWGSSQSGSFPMSQLFTSGGQSIGAWSAASVLPMNIQDWFPSGLTGWISLQSKDSQESFPAPQFKGINFLALSLLYGPTLISMDMITWKTIALTIQTFVSKGPTLHSEGHYQCKCYGC